MPNFAIWLNIIMSCATFASLPVSAGPDHNWDVLIFTQHWPNTVCTEWMEKAKQHTCVLPQVRNTWTIHGIWPTKLGTIGPQFCNHTLKFDPAKLEPIMDQLEQYWLNIYNGTITSLWKHEWTKHGTCAASLPDLDTELKYFSQGLHWINNYNMEYILGRAGINPDVKGYTPEQVWDAVHGALGTIPAVECVKDPQSGEWFLFEIRICFDKNLTLTDCTGIKSNGEIKTNCPANKLLLYPGKIPGDKQLLLEDVRQPYRAPWLLTALRVIQWLQWVTL